MKKDSMHRRQSGDLVPIPESVDDSGYHAVLLFSTLTRRRLTVSISSGWLAAANSLSPANASLPIPEVERLVIVIVKQFQTLTIRVDPLESARRSGFLLDGPAEDPYAVVQHP